MSREKDIFVVPAAAGLCGRTAVALRGAVRAGIHHVEVLERGRRLVHAATERARSGTLRRLRAARLEVVGLRSERLAVGDEEAHAPHRLVFVHGGLEVRERGEARVRLQLQHSRALRCAADRQLFLAVAVAVAVAVAPAALVVVLGAQLVLILVLQLGLLALRVGALLDAHAPLGQRGVQRVVVLVARGAHVQELRISREEQLYQTRAAETLRLVVPAHQPHAHCSAQH